MLANIRGMGFSPHRLLGLVFTGGDADQCQIHHHSRARRLPVRNGCAEVWVLHIKLLVNHPVDGIVNFLASMVQYIFRCCLIEAKFIIIQATSANGRAEVWISHMKFDGKFPL